MSSTDNLLFGPTQLNSGTLRPTYLTPEEPMLAVHRFGQEYNLFQLQNPA